MILVVSIRSPLSTSEFCQAFAETMDSIFVPEARHERNLEAEQPEEAPQAAGKTRGTNLDC